MEHDDEYIDAGHTAGYMRDEVIKGLPLSPNASMRWTTPTGAVEHVIGNRFSVRRAREALVKLRSELDGAHHRMQAARASRTSTT